MALTVHEDVEKVVAGCPILPDSGLVRTLLVFLDLPLHCEFRAEPMPILPVGFVIEFDKLLVRDPSNLSRGKTVSGPHRVERRKYVYSSKRPSLLGLTQYLELRTEFEDVVRNT